MTRPSAPPTDPHPRIAASGAHARSTAARQRRRGARRIVPRRSRCRRATSAAMLRASLIRSQLRLGDRLRASDSPCCVARSSCSRSRSCPARLDVVARRRAGVVAAARRRRLPARHHRRRRSTCARPPATRPATARSRRTSEPGDRLHRDRGRRARVRAHRVLRAAGLAHDERLLRRVAHGAAVVERVGDRRRVPVGRDRSSASPDSSCSRARRRSGSRSATRPATSCCCCSSRRRCAARARTRSPTSPRRGSSRVAARRVTSILVIVIGWFYIVPQLQGAALTVRITTGLPVVGRGRSPSP